MCNESHLWWSPLGLDYAFFLLQIKSCHTMNTYLESQHFCRYFFVGHSNLLSSCVLTSMVIHCFKCLKGLIDISIYHKFSRIFSLFIFSICNNIPSLPSKYSSTTLLHP